MYLLDANLPMYWRGVFNLMLIEDDEDNPTYYARESLTTFERLVEQ